jgi:chromate reductase
MITIFASTHRLNNNTQHIAQYYFNELSRSNSQVQLLKLEDLPIDFMHANEIFGNAHEDFSKIVSQYITDAQKFIFIIPEYNGGFPGMLKTFVDSVHPKHFRGKKAALVGLSSGRGGNIRGLEHFAGVLNYLDVAVLPKRLHIAAVEQVLQDKLVTDAEVIRVANDQMQRFLAF